MDTITQTETDVTAQQQQEAVEFLKGLFEADDTLCITFVHSTEKNEYGQAVTQNKFGKMSYYMSERGLAALQKRNDSGWHVYLSMQPFLGGSRERLLPNVSTVRHVFLDLDKNGPESLAKLRQAVKDGVVPQPTFIVESSPNKSHVQWNAEDLNLNEARALNTSLLKMFNGDTHCVDVARVLRIPGFVNCKPEYGPNFPVARIIERGTDDIYSLSDFHIPVEVVDYNIEGLEEGTPIEFNEAVFHAAVEKELEGPSIPYGSHDGTLFTIGSRLRHYAGDEEHIYEALVEICEARCLNYGSDYKEMCKAKAHNVCERYDVGTLVGKPTLFFDASKHINVRVTVADETPAPSEPSEVAGSVGTSAATATAGNAGATLSVPKSLAPVLSDAAYYGIVGDIIRKLSPETESHPAGNMMALLSSLGSIMGRNPYVVADGAKHFTNLFVVNVGATSRSRKGSGRAQMKLITEQIDPKWADFCQTNGLGSGEVVIQSIQDDVYALVENKKTGEWEQRIVAKGNPDKRLYVSEGEFGRILTVNRRQDSILSMVLRDGWDSSILRNKSKGDKCMCKEPHLSVNADITQQELMAKLPTVEMFNGFVNRFIWIHVERQGLKPHGGETIDWSTEVSALHDIIAFARKQKRVYLTHNAKRMWERIYEKLSHEDEGIIGAIMARGEPQILRIALIFAMCDKATHIDSAHLLAAEALWDYSMASVRHIFEGKPSGDRAMLLDFLRECRQPQTRTDIYRDCFCGHRKADLILEDLEALIRHKLVVQIPGEPETYKAAPRGRNEAHGE